MATEVVSTTWDDILLAKGEHSPGVRTTFSVNDDTYEIDLGATNREALHDALALFIKHGRRIQAGHLTGRRRKSTRPQAARDRAAQVRAWAKQRGHKVSERGRIPEAVIAEFNASSHQDPSAAPAVHPIIALPLPAAEEPAARETPKKETEAVPELPPPDNAEVRAWCAANNVPVNRAGPYLKGSAVDAYNADHPSNPYRGAASAGPERAAPPPPDATEIRAWCKQPGVSLNDRGPVLKDSAVAAWDKAHKDRPVPTSLRAHGGARK